MKAQEIIKRNTISSFVQDFSREVKIKNNPIYLSKKSDNHIGAIHLPQADFNG